MPRPEDEAVARAADAELEAENWPGFLLIRDGETWGEYLDRVEREHVGNDLPEGRVPAAMFLAFVDDELIGRVHIRHDLNEYLLAAGGHIGYAVRPVFRRRGYATELLQAGLEFLRDLGVERALITRDDDNVGSYRTIEKCGGELENVVVLDGEPAKRRYWIDIPTADGH